MARKQEIPEWKRAYIKKHYKKQPGRAIAEKLGVSTASVSRIARELGMEKRNVTRKGASWTAPVKRVWPRLSGWVVFEDINVMPDEYYEVKGAYTKKSRKIIGETAELIVTRSARGYIETFRKKDPEYMLKARER